MPWIRGEFKATEDEARSELTVSLYGDELDDMEGRLDQVVNGALRDLAGKLAVLEVPDQGVLDEPGTVERITAWETVRDQLAQLIDPDQPDPEGLKL